MKKLVSFTALAFLASAGAHASDTVRCAAGPQVRANFISGEMIRALDDANGALRVDGWRLSILRDAENHADRLDVVCAANPELSLSSALGIVATPTIATASATK